MMPGVKSAKSSFLFLPPEEELPDIRRQYGRGENE
jgi:hypothetical protein